MVLEITQETFNGAVKENEEILGLSNEEAIEEAVKQFESQGVDLSKIVKVPMSEEQYESVKTTVERLEQLQKTKGGVDNIVNTLDELKLECDKGVEYKVAAGKLDAYDILLNTYETFNDKTVRVSTLKTLVSLMTKQPDLLEDRGITMIINNLKNQNEDPEIQRLLLKWTKECCVMHEMNRQKIFDAHIVDVLKDLMKESSPIEVIRESLSVCRGLVLDDDVRVEFGRAHEHARIIASETLCAIMSFMKQFKGEEQLNSDILLTLTALMVRSEFCKKVDDAGGLELIKSVMDKFADSDKITRQSFKVIKALAGNDEVKANLIKKGYVEVIKNSLSASRASPQTSTAGLSAVAALTLRSPENSKAFFEGGIADVIVDIMRTHSDEKAVQKSGSWAIRNMVSRSRYQTSKFLELGVEDVLTQDLKNFKDIEYDIKAALRDLGCKVSLKEEWTGKGGALNTGRTRMDSDN